MNKRFDVKALGVVIGTASGLEDFGNESVGFYNFTFKEGDDEHFCTINWTEGTLELTDDKGNVLFISELIKVCSK
jgi:hypothetical protein